MSNIDYTQICPEFYTNYEDGCCMENCIYNDLDECPIHYVKGLLDEKDKAIENWQTMYESVVKTCHNDKEEIEKLNKILAEKEKEIKKLTLLYFGDENTETILTTNKMIQHIKISFAVEQLEKVKEFLINSVAWWGYKCDGVSPTEFIDNQIKQLKEGK